jgi:hypothetical protein
LGEVAQKLLSHRRSRASQRQRVHVWDVRKSRAGQSMRWSKAAVAATLERTYGVGQTSARILAGEVEGHLLQLGYADVSSTLVAELMRCEALAWGIEAESARKGGRSANREN